MVWRPVKAKLKKFIKLDRRELNLINYRMYLPNRNQLLKTNRDILILVANVNKLPIEKKYGKFNSNYSIIIYKKKYLGLIIKISYNNYYYLIRFL